MDTYKMTKDEFKKHSATRQFTDQPTNDKFNIVWLRLTTEERRDLIEIIRKNSIQDIKDSDAITNQILQTFSEARYITLDIETIVNQVKDFDDDLPLNLIG